MDIRRLAVIGAAVGLTVATLSGCSVKSEDGPGGTLAADTTPSGSTTAAPGASDSESTTEPSATPTPQSTWYVRDKNGVAIRSLYKLPRAGRDGNGFYRYSSKTVAGKDYSDLLSCDWGKKCAELYDLEGKYRTLTMTIAAIYGDSTSDWARVYVTNNDGDVLVTKDVNYPYPTTMSLDVRGMHGIVIRLENHGADATIIHGQLD